MKKIFISLFIIAFISANGYSKDSYIKKRMNFKLGYSSLQTGSRTDKGNGYTADRVPNLKFEANYGISNYIEAGLFYGFSRKDSYQSPYIASQSINTDSLIYTAYSNSFDSRKASASFYGVSVNFHLLPFLIKEDNFRFDLYLPARLGGYYNHTKENYIPSRGHITTYEFGAGIAFYFGKHTGLYAEYTYGKRMIKNEGNLRYGLSLKF